MPTSDQPVLEKIMQFPLTKILIGILVVAGSVALVEWIRRSLLDRTNLTDNEKNFIVAVTESLLALLSYILLFKFYEKRQIKELSFAIFWKNASIGFLTGLLLQSLLILVIYLAGGYHIISINPVSFLIPAFTTA